jgi:hypothetical protein
VEVAGSRSSTKKGVFIILDDNDDALVEKKGETHWEEDGEGEVEGQSQ